jgi:hypothetical protein
MRNIFFKGVIINAPFFIIFRQNTPLLAGGGFIWKPVENRHEE